MNQENQLILDICKFQAPNKEKIALGLEQLGNSPAVLGKLLLHRMGGIAYGVLRECGLLSAVNREFRTTLYSIYTASCLKNQSFYQSLTLLADCLQDVTVPYAALKGAYLADKYPLGYRTSNDIDLLLAPEHVTEISGKLMQAGFKQGYVRNGIFREASRSEIIYSRMNKGETVPYILKTNYPFMEFVEIDLNFSLDYKPSDGETVKRMLNTYRKTTSELHTLNKEDFFIHLCAHLYKEATTYAWIEMGRDLSLYKFADIYLLLCEFEAQDYVVLEQRIHELGMEQECVYAMLGTEQLFSIRDAGFLSCIKRLSQNGTTILDKVIDPARGKEYVYTVDFCTRFFDENRKNHLKEVGPLGATAYV